MENPLTPEEDVRSLAEYLTEKYDHLKVHVLVGATVDPLVARIKLRDGRVIDWRHGTKPPVGYKITMDDVESITYYTAETSPDCKISVGTVGEATAANELPPPVTGKRREGATDAEMEAALGYKPYVSGEAKD